MNLSSRSLQTLDDARALALFGLKLQSLLLSLNGDREKEKESRQEVGKKKKKKKRICVLLSEGFLLLLLPVHLLPFRLIHRR